MKIYLFVAIALVSIASSCGNNESADIKSTEEFSKVESMDTSCDHVLTEAYEEERSAHYFDENMLIYNRMILPIELNDRGQLFVRNEPSSFEGLKKEMHNFYFANRDLGPNRTIFAKKDDYYPLKDYPFFNYFNEEEFKSYLDRIEAIAKKDSVAHRHYINHQNRYKSFEAVDEGTTLPFLEFGALILIEFDEKTAPNDITELENKVAENICAFREEIAQREFHTSYFDIREKAKVDPREAYKLVCLQEMVPAYIKKGRKSKTKEAVPLELPPPPIEELIEIDDERPTPPL